MSVTIPCCKWDSIFSKQPTAQAMSAAFWKWQRKTWNSHGVKKAFGVRTVPPSLVIKNSFLVDIRCPSWSALGLIHDGCLVSAGKDSPLTSTQTRRRPVRCWAQRGAGGSRGLKPGRGERS